MLKFSQEKIEVLLRGKVYPNKKVLSKGRGLAKKN
jgi:hypothetical protein